MSTSKLRLLSCFLGVICVLGFLTYYELNGVYATTDIANYGKYIGNRDDKTPTQYIDSFFPSQIESFFSDTNYSYKAKRRDTYACEAYLEFTIPDPQFFDSYYYQAVSQHGTPEVFPFDNDFEIWTIDNELLLSETAERQNTDRNNWRIIRAKQGLILCDKSSSRFIYSALLVWDGGMNSTADFNRFFSRFNINPIVYSSPTKY